MRRKSYARMKVESWMRKTSYWIDRHRPSVQPERWLYDKLVFAVPVCVIAALIVMFAR